MVPARTQPETIEEFDAMTLTDQEKTQ